jgi:hypothetical protein
MKVWIAVAVLSLGGTLGAVTPTAAVTSNEGPAYIAPNAPIHLVTDEENGVYAAFLTQAWNKVDGSAPMAREMMLLENDSLDSWQPSRRAWEKYLLKRVRGQGRSADEAHIAFLNRPVQVVRFYSFPAQVLSVRLLRSDILNKVLQEKGWDGYYETYPKTQGILSLTTIAFGANHTEAVFGARLQCGKRCGYRDIIFMRRVNGVWTLIMKDALP